jgi:hypothetical protein
MKTNGELEKLIRGEKKDCKIYKITMQNTLGSARDGTETTGTVRKLTEWETCSSRAVGRPRVRWLDQVKEDLKKMK